MLISILLSKLPPQKLRECIGDTDIQTMKEVNKTYPGILWWYEKNQVLQFPLKSYKFDNVILTRFKTTPKALILKGLGTFLEPNKLLQGIKCSNDYESLNFFSYYLKGKKAIEWGEERLTLDPTPKEMGIVENFRKTYPTFQASGIFLDYGTGNGGFGVSLACLLGFKQVLLADVEDHRAQIYKSVKFVKIENGKILLPDNSVDFINIKYVLHHIPDLNTAMSELYRVLAYGGYVFFYDHNCTSQRIANFLDLHHLMYEIMSKSPSDALQTYFSDYRSMEDWNKIFYIYGFSAVDPGLVFNTKNPLVPFSVLYRK